MLPITVTDNFYRKVIKIMQPTFLKILISGFSITWKGYIV